MKVYSPPVPESVSWSVLRFGREAVLVFGHSQRQEFSAVPYRMFAGVLMRPSQ